ncbi:MAG: hypothetical protein ABJJ53_06880 [Sulfitobacter sp.]
MNTAFTLLRHAFTLVAKEPLKTVSVVAPALTLMCGVGVITAVSAPELLTIDPAHPDLKSIKSVKLAVILLSTFIFSYSLMAILWHRHTLGEKRPPQPMTLRLLLGYLWRVLALALIQMTAGLALVIPLIVANSTGTTPVSGPALPSMLITSFVTQLLMLWLSLRLSLILPAAALGRPITMAHSWQFTLSLSRPLWGVAAALALLSAVMTGITAMMNLSQPLYMLMLELPIYVVEGLLIFSVLTTLYATQIQRGEADDL